MLRRKLLSMIVAASLVVGVGFSNICYAKPPAPDPNSNVGTHDLIRNSTFTDGIGLPWTEVETAPAHADFDISGGTYNITVTKPGSNIWDVQFRHRDLDLEAGHKYHVEFTVTADKDCDIYPQIAMSKDPYTQYWHFGNWENVHLTANQPKTVTGDFTMTSTDKAAEFAFHISNTGDNSKLPIKYTFDNIHLTDPQYTQPAIPDENIYNAVRVNQVGYYPNLEKIATVTSDSTSPIPWQLQDSTGAVVASGQTKVFNNDEADEASGDKVHIIDFTSYNKAGKGYKLVVNGDTDENPASSVPFDIGTDLYSNLKQDSIKYFYHSRSGIPIQMPYCGDASLARPAGHPSDIMGIDPNSWYASKANYSLDVTGGWYDAGDHGKYVVNGGISVWTMMNQYERALYNGGDLTKAPFADKTMNIPESGNGLPDILDETRFEMEMLLKMQVPAGNTYAGMVHHKGHDDTWTGLGVRPDQDTKPRYLKPPSTAATLNLAAVAAQSSRLWKDKDEAFSTKCVTAAETAWKAALAHPDIYADTGDIGGGAYSDNHVTDEFYWAAAELYATTGKQEYLDYIQKSPYYLQMPTELDGAESNGNAGAFDWGNVQGLGTITLATVPNGLPKADVDTAKTNIEKAADTFIDHQSKEGYGTSLAESQVDTTYHGVTGPVVKGYPWGSNSFVANEAIVMAYAYDFSKDSKYMNGMEEDMDYLLGRNPNVKSYVTGYGTNRAENPHHRFWAHQADPTFPKAPAGCFVGGPNSALQDPWVKGSGWHPGEKAPEKCYMDNIESWSTNEITINWNAPMAWISSYLDDNASKANATTVKYGDVNDDGVVNGRDAMLLTQYLAGKPVTIDTKAADVNGDGAVNGRDMMLIRQYLAGKITSFPAENK
ncbi:glycoside hydrolase family 9 protein [Clostridium felsineum]|uniref:Endoglucanase n=1 Tax=Clostridium felsineum TaxID=36839 RepID=A0A1S8LVB7_9CLOT|nr:glycoside hydrolase family 9 protein [Clostridium felsineum]URZ05282.1 Cellulose 1,4-beta-cellobiosidase [Clostridium felsineum]URZ10323.1 Cellulose 1,4-beta-cellobiosidase [Clostridium felsineum]